MDGKDLIIIFLVCTLVLSVWMSTYLMNNLGQAEQYVAEKCANSKGKDSILINGKKHFCWPIGELVPERPHGELEYRYGY